MSASDAPTYSEFWLPLAVLGGPNRRPVAGTRRGESKPTSHFRQKKALQRRLPPDPLHGKFVDVNISDLIRNEGHVKTLRQL
jgi:hypothetical protein